MKTFVCMIHIVFLTLNCNGQFTQIPTGTTSDLVELSVIGKQIVVNDTWGYSVKSDDECNTFLPITLPGPVGHIKRLQRLDSNNWFLETYDLSQITLYKSTDGGTNWTQKLDTTGAYSSFFRFFDSDEGIITKSTHFIRTNDDCNTWNLGTISLSGSVPSSMSCIKTYDDSIVCIASGSYFSGFFSISWDRGNTWPSTWAFINSLVNYGNVPADLCFLNKDTIFVISRNGESSKTFNKGSTWTNSPIPLTNSYGVNFISATEGYIVGSDSQGKGVILKTHDLGKTWWTFNTGYNTTLLNIVFLNDSTALLSGTNGVLLKWKYRQAVFVGLEKKLSDNITFRVYPNPTSDKINFTLNNLSKEIVDLELSNSLGQIVFTQNGIVDSGVIDVKFLKAGIYYLKLESKNEKKMCKIIKE